MNSSAVTIDQAFADRSLLGAALGDADTWSTWLAVLKGAFGLTLNRAERRAFSKVAGGRKSPRQRVQELWAIAGRRSGKSRIAAAIAVFLACFGSYRLSAGEIGFVLVLAASRSQAGVVFSYCEAFLRRSPVLAQMIESVTQDEIRLSNGVIIGVHVNSFRSIRGRTLIGCIFDEAAFWRDDRSANPDLEVYRAVLPSLATTGGMLIGISSPYRRIGLLHQKHRDHFGQNDDAVLVVQGPTETFNPTIERKIIQRAHADDAIAAASEWGAQFRSDISQFLADDVIDAAIDPSRPLEIEPQRGKHYIAFVDVSAGRNDAYTICIGHTEGNLFIADVVRGRAAPFKPGPVTAEYAELVKSYGIRRVTGDNYSGEWAAEAWRECGITYERASLTKSQIYIEGLATWNQNQVSIPDLQPLSRELRLLERRTSRAGRDIVDHGIGGHDDFPNVVFGALWLAQKAGRRVARVGTYPVYGSPAQAVMQPRSAPRALRVVLTDENGNEITPEQAQAIRRGDHLPHLSYGQRRANMESDK